MSVHKIPILKDSATASTCVYWGSSNTQSSETTVYVYDAKNKLVKNKNSSSGWRTVEGYGSATASIRSMKRAKGIHFGRGNKGSSTAYTNWKK